MASTYSTRLRLELMGSGDQSGTWGTTTNTNLGTLLEASIAGRAAVSMTDADYTLTIANGSADEARNMILNISGALTATRNVICPAVSKMYLVKNATTGGQNITLKTSAGSGVTIGPGSTSLVFCDGTNVVDGINSVSNLTFSGTAARIQGDFSNATVANRTSFQDKTTNNPTSIQVLPNGTSQISTIGAYNNSNPTNASAVYLYCDASTARLGSGQTGSGTYLPLGFVTNNAEVGRFDTAGNYLIGSASSSVAYDGASWKWVGYQVVSRNTTADTNQIVFFNPNGSVGFINTNGTATSYNSVSDYRLKENVQPMTGALAKVLTLNPVTYTWKRDGSSGQGFIAHELQAVIPEAATGVKDDVDSQGKPRYQGMDASHVVATLVAAVKELTARVAVLEAR